MGPWMIGIISRKRDGAELTREEIARFVEGVVHGDVPDYQAAALLMAVYLRGLSSRELLDLTEIMRDSGETIPLSEIGKPKIDKHSTGGVGDKVTFVVAPMLASLGIAVPMLAGRGLGHTGGTLDKLESIPGFDVHLSRERFREVLARAGMAIGGQTDTIVPADRRLYALRDATATVSSIPLIASSIMSKKLALDSDAIVLDVKCGSGAFIAPYADAVALAKTLVEIGERAGRKTMALVTSMDQPLGRAVGNGLEIAESLECLRGRGPADLLEVSIALGSLMLEAAGTRLGPKEAEDLLLGAISSGRALEAFRLCVASQGGDARVCDDPSRLPASAERQELRADRNGFVSRLDASFVGMAAVEAGAGRSRQEDGVDHGAGILFSRRRGDPVQSGGLLATVHAASRDCAARAIALLERAFVISDRTPQPSPLVLCRVDASGEAPWRGGVT